MRKPFESAKLELAALFGNRLLTSAAVCMQHANTTTWLPPEPPDAVVFPTSCEEVQRIVGICAQHRVPIVPFGAGTSLEGQVNAPKGGVCIDLRDMNGISTVHADDLDCVVEPGVTREQLNDHLRDQGLFFAVDPGADASLGGMASTRASGTTTIRYGSMRDNVVALKVVLPNGSIMSTSRRARKSAAGYDLTRLMVGAEGTLGVIVELTLKLHGIPEAISAGVCHFPSVEAACEAAIVAIQIGLPVARMELLDDAQVRACNAYSKLSLPERPMLFLEFHGSETGVAEQAQRFAVLASDYRSSPFEWATTTEDRSRLWQARHDAFWATQSLRKGARIVATDVCVPISRLAECISETKRDIEASGLIAPIAGHVGDGNFHCGVAVMMENPREVASADAFIERLTERSLAMGGTCTGEHGIGQGKRQFLEAEHGPAAVEVMRVIKVALDPDGIMNPGKIL